VQEEAVAVNQWRHDMMWLTRCTGLLLSTCPLTLNCAMREHLQSSVRIAHDVASAAAAAADDDDDELAGSSVTLE